MRHIRTVAALAVILMLLTGATAGFAQADSGSAEQYAEALDLLQANDYAGAAEGFSRLGNYEDASRLAMYCQAVAAGEIGLYQSAVSNLNKLGDFRDAALQANYYAGLSYEMAEEYEKATELFSGMEFFRDVTDRLLTYPGKILARDYAAADAAEQAGRLEEALEGFKALGNYSDSAERAEAVLEKIHARDYAAADAAEQAGKLEEALEDFKALGDYSDSAERAEAVLEKIHARDYEAADKAEQAGDYVKAYEGFAALGDYSDSAARAAAVRDKGNYAKAMQCALSGDFNQAYKLFKGLGDYEDSAEKAYVLGVTEFAEVSDRGDGVAAFKFHDVWGVIDVNINNTASPMWDEIGRFNSLGLARVKKDGRYGYINTRGEVVVPCHYEEVSEYSGKRCTVAVKSDKNYLFGLVDENGTVVTEPQWQTLGMSYNSRWNPGVYANNYCYTAAPVFSDGKIMVQDKSGNWGFIDEDGKLVGEVRWTEIKNFSQNLAVVCEEEKYGFIDRNGDVIIEPQYLDARSFHEGLAAVQTSDGWQYITPENEVVIQPLYSQALDFSGGRADVYLPGTGWQIIDKSGALVYFVNSATADEYERAVELLEAGSYAEAREMFEALAGYRDANELAQQARADELYDDGKVSEALQIYAGLPADYQTHSVELAYDEAVEKLEAGEYDEAARTFKAISDYNDAAVLAKESQYRKGMAQMEAGEYDEAAKTFKAILNYNDAEVQAKESQYRKAAELYEKGEYAQAYEVYLTLSGYKDVDSLLESNDKLVEERQASLYAVGNRVMVGSYEQDNDTSDGPEPIEWIVLDNSDGVATLISRYALINRPFNDVREQTNWAMCSLRQWLNGDFYSEAFSESEQQRIMLSAVTADKNPYTDTDQGQDAKDRVYLLSVSEVEKYFASEADRICMPTAYCVANGVLTDDSGRAVWWLRTMGGSKGAIGVYSEGGFSNSGKGGWWVEEGLAGVRPVIRVWIGSGVPEEDDAVQAVPVETLSEAETVAKIADMLGNPRYRTTYESLLSEGPVKKGSGGSAAKGVQLLLADFGQGITADGSAGGKTISALNAVQAAFGLEQTDSLDAAGYARLLLRFLAYRNEGLADELQKQHGSYGDDEEYNQVLEYAALLKAQS